MLSQALFCHSYPLLFCCHWFFFSDKITMQEPPRSTTSVPTQEESRSMASIPQVRLSQLKINMVPVRCLKQHCLVSQSYLSQSSLYPFATETMQPSHVQLSGRSPATIFKKTTPNQLLASSCWEWCLWLLTPMVRPQWPLLLLPVTFNWSVMDWW